MHMCTIHACMHTDARDVYTNVAIVYLYLCIYVFCNFIDCKISEVVLMIKQEIYEKQC